IRHEVTGVKKEGGKNLGHTLSTDGGQPSISSGAAVLGELDWERRYKLMRTHSAMHILCGVVWRDYGASVTGGNMDPGTSRMDFEFESLSRDLISEIEARCNAEVAAERAIRTQILPREEAFAIPDLIRTKINLLPEGIREVRTVEIVGLDLQADGGTHVANTSEVGEIRVVDYKSKGKINKRIYIELP
ncbi:MAG: alanyl-tRNA editing protein, partial [Caldilineaceae bacterium]|nr:alanyl-tRNA editing protein [Caldilineaceae bacterium]